MIFDDRENLTIHRNLGWWHFNNVPVTYSTTLQCSGSERVKISNKIL
jgi:hypothetical protein